MRNSVPRIATDLREVAKAVLQMGHGLRCDPEAIAIAKDEIAVRLNRLANELERQR
jgi:hypothetical protein